MVMRLIRQYSQPATTFGVLFVDGEFYCFTLENTVKIIPTGIYGIEFYDSPKNHRIVPLLQYVPDREYIEIHPANYPWELEGCIGVGTSIATMMLADSKIAFNKLMQKIKPTDKPIPKDLQIRIENWNDYTQIETH
jgi:hypothetical protein